MTTKFRAQQGICQRTESGVISILIHRSIELVVSVALSSLKLTGHICLWATSLLLNFVSFMYCSRFVVLQSNRSIETD
jgi:hypothetical protein